MIAVVTGAGRGIGRAVAHALAARGCHVAILARSGHELDETAGAIRAQGGRATVFACDLAEPPAIASATARVLTQLGAPAVVVNNAGVVQRSPVQDTTDADWNHVIQVNLTAAFQVTRAFLPAMLAAGAGRFVHIASISSTLGTPKLSAYCASKWGLVGFGKSLAEELRGTGLSSMCVMPGSVDTAMLAGSGLSPAMTPEDVANAVTYAALDAPLAMNGSAIEVFGP
jgi:3-oxoacyl-[acyl-carrier protein] reductase